MISFLIADDQKMFRDLISTMLQQHNDYDVSAAVENGAKALEYLSGHKVDIVLLDQNMPELSGLEVMQKIKLSFPSVKVIFLTEQSDKLMIERIMKSGADGFITKSKSLRELEDTIQKILNGEKYFGKEGTELLLNGFNRREIKSNNISDREHEVLKLIVAGNSTPQIAEILYIADSTVETHRRSLLKKTGTKNLKLLIRFALENNLI